MDVIFFFFKDDFLIKIRKKEKFNLPHASEEHEYVFFHSKNGRENFVRGISWKEIRKITTGEGPDDGGRGWVVVRWSVEFDVSLCSHIKLYFNFMMY